MSTDSEDTRKKILDKAMLALLTHDVAPYSEEKWAELTKGRKAYHYTDKNPLDVDVELLFAEGAPERILLLDRILPQVTSRQAYQGGTGDRNEAFNTLGEQTKVLGKALNAEYKLPHADYVVLNLVADNKDFEAHNPVTGEGNQLEDRNPSHLAAVMTAQAHKALAVEMLKRMAEPKTGAAMFDMDEDKYKQAFSSDETPDKPQRAAEQVIAKAGFTKADDKLLDEVVGVARLHQNNDFATLVTIKKRALVPAETTYAGIVARDGSAVRRV